MADHDESHGDLIARGVAKEAARVLPLVGCPRWLIWLGTLLAVVVYVAGKSLIPHLAQWWKENSAPTTPPLPAGTVVDEGGAQPAGTVLPPDPSGEGSALPTDPENPGGGPEGGFG